MYQELKEIPEDWTTLEMAFEDAHIISMGEELGLCAAPRIDLDQAKRVVLSFLSKKNIHKFGDWSMFAKTYIETHEVKRYHKVNPHKKYTMDCLSIEITVQREHDKIPIIFAFKNERDAVMAKILLSQC